MTNAAVNMATGTSWSSDFVSFSSVPRGGIAGTYGSSSFNFLRSPHAVFHGDCTSDCAAPEHTLLLTVVCIN